jgi:drug/metabolite transporter (DMT)-like permease
MAAYTVNDALMKEIARTFPVGEVIFIRAMFASILIGAVVLALGHVHEIRRAISRPVLTRSLFDGLSTGCFVLALVHMKLADLAAMLQVSPLILTAIAVLWYKEIVGWRRWTAITVGFIGALFVIKPTADAFNVWALFALVAAMSSALRETQTRQIDRSIPTVVIAFMGSISIVLVGLLFSVAEPWQPLPAGDIGLLALAAVFVGIATFLMTLAFRGVDISVVAPFRYSYLITSAVAGYIAFNELPDGWSVFGTLLIVASGLYTLHRETVRRREVTGTTAPAA